MEEQQERYLKSQTSATTSETSTLISSALDKNRLRGQQFEVFNNLNGFTAASARMLFDYDLNDSQETMEQNLL